MCLNCTDPEVCFVSNDVKVIMFHWFPVDCGVSPPIMLFRVKSMMKLELKNSNSHLSGTSSVQYSVALQNIKMSSFEQLYLHSEWICIYIVNYLILSVCRHPKVYLLEQVPCPVCGKYFSSHLKWPV